MKYRYYVHNREENVGVTEFNSEIQNTFIECLIDCIEWFMWESDETLWYEFYVFNGDEKIFITFSFDLNDEMVAYIQYNYKMVSVDRDNVRDWIKSHLS